MLYFQAAVKEAEAVAEAEGESDEDTDDEDTATFASELVWCSIIIGPNLTQNRICNT